MDGRYGFTNLGDNHDDWMIGAIDILSPTIAIRLLIRLLIVVQKGIRIQRDTMLSLGLAVALQSKWARCRSKKMIFYR